MKEHIATTRRQLGELGAMAEKTEADERKILKQAESLLQDVESELAGMNAIGKGEEAETRYTDLIMERGRLHTVISKAREAIGDSA